MCSISGKSLQGNEKRKKVSNFYIYREHAVTSWIQGVQYNWGKKVEHKVSACDTRQLEDGGGGRSQNSQQKEVRDRRYFQPTIN